MKENIDCIVYCAVGIFLVVLGLLTWKKQKISLLRDGCRPDRYEQSPDEL